MVGQRIEQQIRRNLRRQHDQDTVAPVLPVRTLPRQPRHRESLLQRGIHQLPQLKLHPLIPARSAERHNVGRQHSGITPRRQGERPLQQTSLERRFRHRGTRRRYRMQRPWRLTAGQT
jgi:hypothetical protein